MELEAAGGRRTPRDAVSLAAGGGGGPAASSFFLEEDPFPIFSLIFKLEL